MADPSLTVWAAIKDSDRASDFETFLARYPSSPMAAFARNRLAELRRVAVVTPPPAPEPVAPSYAPGETFREMFLNNPNLFKMNMPADAVFLNRITFGLNSIMLLLEASENFYEIHRRYAYPDDNVPPSLTRLGIQIPDRFMSARADPIARASLPPGAPVSSAPGPN